MTVGAAAAAWQAQRRRKSDSRGREQRRTRAEEAVCKRMSSECMQSVTQWDQQAREAVICEYIAAAGSLQRRCDFGSPQRVNSSHRQSLSPLRR